MGRAAEGQYVVGSWVLDGVSSDAGPRGQDKDDESSYVTVNVSHFCSTYKNGVIVPWLLGCQISPKINVQFMQIYIWVSVHSIKPV